VEFYRNAGAGTSILATITLGDPEELGVVRIEGITELSTFRIGNQDIWGLDLQQSGARYSWDGQTALGMIERSAPSAGATAQASYPSPAK
jgi:hypothetical protein